jgi:hypothetical protein
MRTTDKSTGRQRAHSTAHDTPEWQKAEVTTPDGDVRFALTAEIAPHILQFASFPDHVKHRSLGSITAGLRV